MGDRAAFQKLVDENGLTHPSPEVSPLGVGVGARAGGSVGTKGAAGGAKPVPAPIPFPFPLTAGELPAGRMEVGLFAAGEQVAGARRARETRPLGRLDRAAADTCVFAPRVARALRTGCRVA